MYCITYYYLNWLSITDCSAIKKIAREIFFKPPPSKESLGSVTMLNKYSYKITKMIIIRRMGLSHSYFTGRII
jgi:hypothetical protein